MNRNIIETIIGAVVLLVAGGFLAFAYQSSGTAAPTGGYAVKAKFDNASGLAMGSDVRIGGIKVGVVSGMHLDRKSYQALISMSLQSDIQIPQDSSAAVIGDGLLGSKFIAIEPGGSDAMLSQDGVITVTQSSVSLEQLIGKFVFSGGGVDGNDTQKSDSGIE